MSTEPTDTAESTQPARTPFAIEKGHPIPTGTALDRFPFAQMEIGDSFFVPKTEISENTVRSYVSRYLKDKPTIAFRVFAIEGGARIWRTEPKKIES